MAILNILWYTEKMKHAGYLYIYNHYIKVQT